MGIWEVECVRATQGGFGRVYQDSGDEGGRVKVATQFYGSGSLGRWCHLLRQERVQVWGL